MKYVLIVEKEGINKKIVFMPKKINLKIKIKNY